MQYIVIQFTRVLDNSALTLSEDGCGLFKNIEIKGEKL